MLGALGEVCKDISLNLLVWDKTGDNNACFFVAQAGEVNFADGGDGCFDNVGCGIGGMWKCDASPIAVLFVGFVEGVCVEEYHNILCAGLLLTEFIGTTGGIVCDCFFDVGEVGEYVAEGARGADFFFMGDEGLKW